MNSSKKIRYPFFAIAFALCGFALPAISSSAKEVKVYSGRHYASDKKVFKKFEQLTGIKVRLLEAQGFSLIERLKREGDNAKADLILLVDAAKISLAAKNGLLQPFSSDKLQQEVPVDLRDPQKRWYALTRRVRVLVANPSKVDLNEIKTYADLSKPSLKGKVCLRRRNSPYNQSLVANQIIRRGEDSTKKWLKGLIDNSQPLYAGDIQLIRAVGNGKCGVAIVNHYYVARMLNGIPRSQDIAIAKKVKMIIPNPAHVNVSAGGIGKYAVNKDEAIKLLEYLASPTGSKGLASPTYEHPLKGSNNSVTVRRFGSFRPDGVKISELGEKNAKAIKLMRNAGWD